MTLSTDSSKHSEKHEPEVNLYPESSSSDSSESLSSDSRARKKKRTKKKNHRKHRKDDLSDPSSSDDSDSSDVIKYAHNMYDGRTQKIPLEDTLFYFRKRRRTAVSMKANDGLCWVRAHKL